MTPRKTRKSLALENDAAAVRWAGPFGYAVLETLRLTDHFAEADFGAFMAKAPVDLVPEGRLQVEDPGVIQVDPASVRVAQRVTRQVTMSEANPYGAPDFAGDPTPEPYVSKVAAGQVLEPAPPADFYRRVTTAGRPGQPPAPSGRRDASGRYVRPAR